MGKNKVVQEVGWNIGVIAAFVVVTFVIDYFTGNKMYGDQIFTANAITVFILATVAIGALTGIYEYKK